VLILGFRISKCVDHAHAIHRLLPDADDALRFGETGGSQNRRCDVDNVMKLGPQRRRMKASVRKEVNILAE